MFVKDRVIIFKDDNAIIATLKYYVYLFITFVYIYNIDIHRRRGKYGYRILLMIFTMNIVVICCLFSDMLSVSINI